MTGEEGNQKSNKMKRDNSARGLWVWRTGTVRPIYSTYKTYLGFIRVLRVPNIAYLRYVQHLSLKSHLI